MCGISPSSWSVSVVSIHQARPSSFAFRSASLAQKTESLNASSSGSSQALHVFTADPDAAGMKLIARRPTTTKRDLPVPQDGCGRMASEVDELEELHPVAFRRQNELMLDAIEADLERNVLKRKPEMRSMQSTISSPLSCVLSASIMARISASSPSKAVQAFCVRSPEGEPRKNWQRHALETVLHEFFGILVLGFGFVRPSEP